MRNWSTKLISPFLACIVLAAGHSAAQDTVDLRFSPPQWQAAICLPDDPYKTLVAKDGSLFNNGPHIGVEVVGNAVWQKQELHSPRVPIIKTYYTAPDLEIVQEAFVVTNEADQPCDSEALLAERLNTKAVGRLSGGSQRADVILVHVTNTGKESRTLQPVMLTDGKRSPLEPLTVRSGTTETFFVQHGGRGMNLKEALAERDRAVEFWERKAGLPFGRIEVPDAGIQALIDSAVRNIWQAREIKNGLPAFQVGPTCYRGLWLVDGAFILEAATLLGAGDQARNGVAYELTHQKDDGRIEVMQDKYGYWKENGIVIWTCVRHAMLTQDKAWLESVWPKLQRIAAFIKVLRTDDPLPCKDKVIPRSPHTALDAGLIPHGIADGGIHNGLEYGNTYWSLVGLRSYIEAAKWLGKADEAAGWQKEYDDFMKVFRAAAKRDMARDPSGNDYLPILMGEDGRKQLPQRAQWSFCHAVYPGQIFAKDDPLVAGNMAMLKATEREGMVYGTGWDATGIWNYFASFYGHAWLWQGNGGKAAQILYAFANHASPVLDWREEQSLRGEHYKEVGDMPHNWASAEFIRLTAHLLALDRGNELHLLEGLPAEWTMPGMVTSLNGVATPFGKLTMQLKIDGDGKSARLKVDSLSDPSCRKVVVHQGGWAGGAPDAVIELDPKAGTDRSIPITRPATTRKEVSSNDSRVATPMVAPQFTPLPVGKVEPAGWLRDWAVTMRNGITGHLDERHPVYRDGWKGVGINWTGANADGTGWPLEQSAYWLDGAIRLGYILHDQTLIDKIRARLDPVVDGVNRAPNGTSFIHWKPQYKPQGFDNWAHSHMGRALVALYQGSGEKRVLDALDKVYSDYPADLGPLDFGDVRGLCNLDAMMETYSYTGDKRILERANAAIGRPDVQKLIHNWSEENLDCGHMVITYENIRVPAVMYPWTGNAVQLKATEGAFRWLERNHLMPYGLSSGEEYAAGVGASRKTEACTIPAMLLSAGWMYRITGDGAWGDRMEKAFLNAGPAPLARDCSVAAYYQAPNRIKLGVIPVESPNPGQGGIAFGPLACSHVLCCIGAVNRILPYFIANMWMAVSDGGLVATLYGPCTVDAVAGKNTKVRITCNTDYPFNESIIMNVEPEKEAEFPLYLRIPSWCKSPVLQVNGVVMAPEPGAVRNGFVRISREWRKGDVVTLSLPMAVSVTRGVEGPYPDQVRGYFHQIADDMFRPRALPYASVQYGPLLFCLPIEEKDLNTPSECAKWQYALNLNPDQAAGIKVERKPMPKPWNWPADAPLSMRVPACWYQWNPDMIHALPDKPVPADKPDSIRLIPYGCAKFQISMFPVTEDAWRRIPMPVNESKH